MRLYKRNSEPLDLVDFMESEQMQIDDFKPVDKLRNRETGELRFKHNITICDCGREHVETDPCPCCGFEG